MPSRNIVKVYGEGQYYHVYNRGVNKQTIFADDADYRYMLTLLKQRLSAEPARDKQRRPIKNFHESVDLVAYCLMPNHYHMLLYLKRSGGIEQLMRSVMTAYSGYYNRRHGRVGALFQNHFLASRITSDAYLEHVSRYIHLNPLDVKASYDDYDYSSLRYYDGRANAEWVTTHHIAATERERVRYLEFVADGAEFHELYHQLRDELANG